MHHFTAQFISKTKPDTSYKSKTDIDCASSQRTDASVYESIINKLQTETLNKVCYQSGQKSKCQAIFYLTSIKWKKKKEKNVSARREELKKYISLCLKTCVYRHKKHKKSVIQQYQNSLQYCRLSMSSLWASVTKKKNTWHLFTYSGNCITS